MRQHTEGHMNVTHFRHPVVYGPWQLRTVIFEWTMHAAATGGRMPFFRMAALRC